ncbi:hypothetical protein MXB_273 [Myxobolus squamalis]|nr:hypothetical protein MXB_273 [Myxobolus squamalis]
MSALTQLNLIKGTLAESRYSRCGRTDADVSAVGQVVSCRMRANYKIDDILTDPEKNERDDKLYILGLNNLLPIDIRVVSWSRVSDNFNARFCTLTVIGNAFLHNQIRNIASVLVSVGLGYEDISVFSLNPCSARLSKNYLMLTNIQTNLRTPYYLVQLIKRSILGLPLILYDCAYENVEWQSPSTKHNSFSKQKHKF